jgi:glycine/D-amino acid oxidase-like deaminating enzyme
MRIAVIGAGIVGVHLAGTLARRGAEVTLIDRSEPGGATTAGSFAWIDASAPGVAPYLELRVLGVRAWRAQAQALGDPAWLALKGTLIWSRDVDEAPALEHHAQRLAAAGHPVQRLSAERALRYEPDLRLPAGIECVYRFEGEGWVETRPAIDALLSRSLASGLKLRSATEVSELSLDSRGGVRGFALASGERVSADAVVCCLGRFTESLLSSAGVIVPMLEPPGGPVSVAGLIVRTTPLESRLGGVALADGLLMRPDGGSRLLLHSDACDVGQTGEPPRPGAGEPLLALLAQRLRGAEEARVEDARVCVRALPADLLPVVGQVLEGLYVVATHSGVTLAPALAELIASELLDGARREELERFRPGRFGSIAA